MTYAWVKGLCRHGPNAYCDAVLDDNLVDLCIALEVEVLMDRTGGVNISMRRVGSAASLDRSLARNWWGLQVTHVSVNPFQPVLSTVASNKILEIIGSWDALRLGGSKEVLHDWVGVIPKRYFDWALEAVNVSKHGVTIVDGCSILGPYLLFDARWYVSCFLMRGMSSLVVQPFAWKSS